MTWARAYITRGVRTIAAHHRELAETRSESTVIGMDNNSGTSFYPQESLVWLDGTFELGVEF